MGFVLLGVFAWNRLALSGAVMQMIAHGLSTGALFVMVGALQERLHTRDMGRMGGLWGAMPRMGAVGMFFAVASLGLPGLANFVGEFLVLLGTYRTTTTFAAAAALGLIVSVAYALALVQRTFHGTARIDLRPPDLGAREMAAMAAMGAGVAWLGVYPQAVLDLAGSALAGLQALAAG
jgi:NADH-quinone oxidoreductase subunit M